MPYIKQERRNAAETNPQESGELNFAITRLVLKFLSRKGPVPRYQDFNDAIGALECAKQELYRRMVSPYEDKKVAENGDVYS